MLGESFQMSIEKVAKRKHVNQAAFHTCVPYGHNTP